MSSPARPAPPSNRRWGWSPMPPHCPRCESKLTFSRRVSVNDPTCPKCHSVLYLLVCVPIHAVFIVETTSRELHWLNEQQMTPAEVLAYFGAAFPGLVNG